MGPHRILLDCGLADIAPLTSADAPPADFVFCSHAHTDHARGLLALHQAFPSLPIYSSQATAELLPLNWPQADVPSFCAGLPWRVPIALTQGLTVELWPAGHLPGAACLLLAYVTPARTYRVFYTGDCFLSASRLAEGLPLEALRGLSPDVLIVEGTYGTLRQLHRRQQENQLAERLRQMIDREPTRRIVFPAPIIGLGQELLLLLRSHHHFTGYPLNVWVDPIIGLGCDAYGDLLESLPRNVQNFAQHQSLFWDERVFPHVKRLLPQPAIAAAPAVFIVHPATPPAQYCSADSGEWTVFIPELSDLTLWQSQLDHRPPQYNWLDALKNSTHSGTVQLETYPLSSHCDGLSTAQFIHNLRPQHVLFMHGAPDRLADLANLEELQARYQIRLPLPGQAIEIMLESQFWQPAPPPETLYEGEVSVDQEAITLALPLEVTQDPRWHQFADTGVVEVRWQGDKLVMRGLSQAEMLTAPPKQRQACAYCRYQKQQRCRNADSPLFGRQVPPSGYCSKFEPQAADEA
ncbi:MAG: MBL fold metallo-hydrolase [Leptolyngbya sp. SIO4C1]|nr:MBL fold metallo-hydrolase [Leptolyngbya sp. SIO4C1]